MKQSTQTLLIFFITIAITFVVIKHFNKKEELVDFDQYTDFPTETKYIHNTQPVKCTLEKVQVKSVSDSSQLLKGSNYLQTWEVELLNIKNQRRKAYLITSTEDPWIQGQEYFLSSNCIPIESEEELKSLKKQVEDGCTSLYFWDKENYQISRQCGYVVGDQPLFLHFKAAKQ